MTSPPEGSNAPDAFSQQLNEILQKFRIQFYMRIFSRFERREATLTTVEAFSMECIMALGEPTISQFSHMMNISAPNTAYRVSSLIQKGYLEKVQSRKDQREYHLRPTRKYLEYYNINSTYLEAVVARCKERFSDEDYKKLTEMVTIIGKELMPESDLSRFKQE